MENKKTQNITVNVELTLEELDLIRHATWALEEQLKKEIQEYIGQREDSFYKTESYWIRANEIDKTMYFDSSILREKVIKEFNSSDKPNTYRDDLKLDAGQLTTRYANQEKS
jgi:hypothetical protein